MAEGVQSKWQERFIQSGGLQEVKEELDTTDAFDYVVDKGGIFSWIRV